MSRFLSESARQLEAERDAAREDVGALQVIIRGLTEERGQLRERIASLEADRDHHMSERLRIESRLMRLQAVAVAADLLAEGRTAHSGCDCDECSLRARLAELQEGDL